jgi:hypothetical protein
MGRWTGFQYRLKEDQKLSIVTAYRVCKRSTSAINNTIQTAHKQQKSMLIRDKVEYTDPRKMFIRDMIGTTKDLCEDPNNYVILMLHAKESLYDSEGGVRKLLMETKLIGTFSIFLLEQNAKYQRIVEDPNASTSSSHRKIYYHSPGE